MSDVSEHDSDSDTEIEKLKQTEKKTTPTAATAVNNEANTTPSAAATTDTSHPQSIVDELKQQVTASTAASSAEEQPDWVKYLEQNSDTGAYTYTDQTDGTVYEWDAAKKGWIPKIDDDFIALYQANYGFTATGEHDPNIHQHAEDVDKTEDKSSTAAASSEKKTDKDKSKTDDTKGTKRKKEEEKKEWFEIDPKENNNVYVSGLPTTITNDEFVELMMKYGIIMEDDEGTMKIKLYRDANGEVKGDGRCCYLKHESVILVCSLLNESIYEGSTIHVEQAVFELKGDYNPSLKPKKKKKKKKKAAGQDKLLDWVDRPKKRSKFDRIVILKQMFDHKDFEKDPSLILELKEDLRTECTKYGEIKKVLVFDRNPEGVASILFAEAEFADACVAALNGRYYAGRTVSAETYDGVTKYDVKETDEEMQKRLDDWESFLGEGEDEEQKPDVTEDK